MRWLQIGQFLVHVATSGYLCWRIWLTRGQENQHVWFTREEVMRWSPAAQRQAGYLMDSPYLGHCNETDPVNVFRASGAVIADT